MHDYRIGFASRWLTETNQTVAGLLPLRILQHFKFQPGFHEEQRLYTWPIP